MPAEVKNAAHGPAHYGGHGTRRKRACAAKRSGQRKAHECQEAEADQTRISDHLEVLVVDEMGRRPESMKLK